MCTAHDYRDPGKPKIAWDDEQAREALPTVSSHGLTLLVAAHLWHGNALVNRRSVRLRYSGRPSTWQYRAG